MVNITQFYKGRKYLDYINEQRIFQGFNVKKIFPEVVIYICKAVN